MLALGIVSLVACPLLGFAPWAMGRADLKDMDDGRMDPEGRGLTEAGKVLGIVSLVLGAIGALIAIVAVFFVIVAGVVSAQ